MKTAIIAFNNICYSPYIFTYADFLKKNGVSCDLIYPNRAGVDEAFDGNTYPILWDKNKSKCRNFISFTKKAKGILKKNKYDFVFVLTTFPAVLLSGVLSRRYKSKYLVDIRDYTYEHSKIYYHFEKKALKNSKLNVISSPGFANFLPDENYYICHNVLDKYKDNALQFKKAHGRIVIGYVGTIAYASQCKAVIDMVRDDDRFEFHFYGNETNPFCPIKQYVDAIGSERIKYFGPYKAAEKPQIIQQVSLLFNVYGNERMLVKYALSNKLYDGFYFKKPLLVSPNTAMSEETKEFSYAIDLSKKGELDKVYDWYNEIDSVAYEKYANEYLESVFVENEKLQLELSELIKEEKR